MLIPTKYNIQKLFVTHQNQCAFSKCKRKIIDEDGHLNGNIFFIESNKKEQPRYNHKLSNEQMIDYHNLVLLCDIHGLDIEWKEKKYTIAKLREEIFTDLKNLPNNNFKFPDKMFEDIIFHFIDKHDPDRLSHVQINSFEYGTGTTGTNSQGVFADVTCTGVYIKPTRHFAGNKFEIIDTRRKIQKFDKVVFYAKDATYSKGIQADVEIKSQMRIEGTVPEFPQGEYFVSLRSTIDESSKLEEDLSFTIL